MRPSESRNIGFEVARGAYLSMAAGFVGVSVLAALSVESAFATPAIVGTMALVGVSPVGARAWRSVRSPSPHLESQRQADAFLAEGAAVVDRIRALAAGSDSGPISDHLNHLADSAADRVDVMTQTVKEVVTIGSHADLQHDLSETVQRLQALVQAAEKLATAQRQHTRTDPIDDLIANTNALAEAIEEITDISE